MRVIPTPFADEYPSLYATRLSEWYLSWKNAKPGLGQVFTPATIAQFMAKLFTLPKIQEVSIRALDPCAGTGILACALCELVAADIELEVYEIDSELVDCLDHSLRYAQRWSESRGHKLSYKIENKDFVLTRSAALQWPTDDTYDLIICNPPYFKLPKSDPRAQTASSIIHGQPNIYAIFMAISVALLRKNGQLVVITPRSYASGPYFQRFRHYFFSKMRPHTIHLFESRREVFRTVLQESVILHAERSTFDSDAEVRISTSLNDLDPKSLTQRILPITDVLDDENVLYIPTSSEHDDAAEIVRSWEFKLQTYGMEISTGPVVPFRATTVITAQGDVPRSHAPLLWMHNVKPMQVTWPLNRKSQYISLDAPSKLLISNQNYVLLRRFTAKEEKHRLTAAPYLAELDTSYLGLENHLNYIYRPGGTLSIEECYGLAALLNSTLMDTYFRIFNGNTQVSATELRSMPLPPLETIIEMGKLIRDALARGMSVGIDTLVHNVLSIYA